MSVKQALLASAKRLNDADIFSQGAGALEPVSGVQALLADGLHASVFPASLHLHDCPYMWPFCAQPLYYSSLPTLLNVTLLNSMAVLSQVTSVQLLYKAEDDKDVLDVHVSHSDFLWPYSGWLALTLSVPRPIAVERSVSVDIALTITSDGGLRQAHVSVPLSVTLVPTPERSRRLVWDQFHNIQYPRAYAPRDNLDVHPLSSQMAAEP